MYVCIIFLAQYINERQNKPVLNLLVYGLQAQSVETEKGGKLFSLVLLENKREKHYCQDIFDQGHYCTGFYFRCYICTTGLHHLHAQQLKLHLQLAFIKRTKINTAFYVIILTVFYCNHFLLLFFLYLDLLLSYLLLQPILAFSISIPCKARVWVCEL